MGEKYYTAREFAEKRGVTRQTVYKWIRKGHLRAIEEKSGPFKHVLIPIKDAEEFIPPVMGRPKNKC